jgi:hypothetical protein
MDEKLLGQNLIFLISQPRAGSTLLQRIFAGHPDIHTTAEPWLMLHPIYALRAKGHTAEYNATLAHTALEDFSNTLEGGQKQYLEALRRMGSYIYTSACQEAKKSYFLDKTPRYYLIIPELAEIFPNAKFIILLRNPLAILASLLHSRVKDHWVLLARYKLDLLTAPKLLIEGMEYLQDRAAIGYYEQLVTNPEDTVRKICDDISVTFYPKMINYGDQEALSGHMGDSTRIDKRKRPTTESLNRWLDLGRNEQTRHFGLSYLNALGPDLLKQLGYNFRELQEQLTATKSQGGKISYTWQELFQPDNDLQNRLKIIELALLEHRRIVHTIKRIFPSKKQG